MSEAALVWAAGQRAPDASCRAVLMRLAAYADPQGESWASVPTLAEETQLSERTVQRCLRRLLDAEFVAPTGRYRYRNIPYYQLALHREGEIARARAERAAARAAKICAGEADPGPIDAPPNGDTVSPLAAGERCHGVTVQDANGDTVSSNGDTVSPNVEDVEDRVSLTLTLSAREAFEALSDAWGAVAPDRVAPPLDWAAFRAASGKEAPGEVLRAGRRYLAESADVARGRCKALKVWLDEERWRYWLLAPPPKAAETTAASPSPAWPGPAEIWAAAVRHSGRDFALSWLGLCEWDEGRRAVLAPRALTVERLTGQPGLRAALEAAGVAAIEVRTAKVGEAG